MKSEIREKLITEALARREEFYQLELKTWLGVHTTIPRASAGMQRVRKAIDEEMRKVDEEIDALQALRRCEFCEEAVGNAYCYASGRDRIGHMTGFTCTRAAGHEGEHVACATNNCKVAIWKD